MLTAPELDRYIVQYSKRNMGDESNRFSRETWDKLKELYKLIDKIVPYGNDNEHILYFKLPRGTIQDYGNFEDYLEWGEVENKEEFIELWKYDYPKDEKWYCMFTKHFTRNANEFYALGFNNKIVIQNEEIYDSNHTDDISKMINELIIIVKEIISKMENNEYNSYVEKNLDKRLRYGTITRKDYYNLFENIRDDYLENLSQDEINKFQKYVKRQMSLPENPNSKWKPSFEIGRLEKVNANDFYNCCLMGYDANKYDKHEGLTAKEAYYKYADGRDDGLRDINENSYEEFNKWFKSKERGGGHPWEVCRGGNSTHISLYIGEDEKGFYFEISGKSYGRSIETIRFFNALRDNNIPIYLCDAEELLNRVLEKDKIGIVPDYTVTKYQESNFQNEKIIDFVHLDYEKEEEMIKLAEWKELEKAYLL